MYTRDSALSTNVNLVRAAKIALLVTLGLLIPALGLPQPATGPLVNALLILSVETVGVGPAMLVGMVTPLNAVLHGILPLPIAVMIPFIALSNATLVGLYGALRGKNYWLALGAGAVAKFALLYATVTVLAANPLSVVIGGVAQRVAIAPAIAYTMQWPQLATALVGGVIAFAAMTGYRTIRK